MIVQFARRNLGVASVVYDFAREALESGELFELKIQKKIPERFICIVQGSHATVAIYVVNQRISNVYRIAGAALQRSNS